MGSKKSSREQDFVRAARSSENMSEICLAMNRLSDAKNFASTANTYWLRVFLSFMWGDNASSFSHEWNHKK